MRRKRKNPRRNPAAAEGTHEFVKRVQRQTAGSGLKFVHDPYTRVQMYRVFRHGKAQPIARSVLVGVSGKGLDVVAVRRAGIPSELPLNPSVASAASYLLKLDKFSRGRAVGNPRRRSRRNPTRKAAYAGTPYKPLAKILTEARRRTAAGESTYDVVQDLVNGYDFGFGSANHRAIEAAAQQGDKNGRKTRYRRNPLWRASKVARRLRRPGHKKFAVIMRKLRKSKKNRGR